jgi:hypothetical protein
VHSYFLWPGPGGRLPASTWAIMLDGHQTAQPVDDHPLMACVNISIGPARPYYSSVLRVVALDEQNATSKNKSERRIVMKVDSKRFSILLAGLFVLVATVAWQAVLAEDVVHAVSGIVKSVDKTTKTMVVKTSDGTEHTIKWTGKTTVEGAKATGKGAADAGTAAYDGTKEGTKVTVKYTEKAGEKTAVAVKEASKATAKAVTQ